jgi:dTDP-4-amino-4,6-dideoxygalactose transaminase
MITVPFLDLKAPYLELKDELDEAYKRVMDSGWYILGKEVEAFETEFAAYCESQHCIGVGNGLDALHLILRAMEIGPGDEVIVPSNTYIATWLAVSYVGATPVPIEPDEKTYNIAPSLIEAAITNKTRAIMVVHLYGQPADMDAIDIIAQKYQLKLVVDGAHAHGARYKGSRSRCQGDAAAYSFFPSKNLGAIGDGGAVVTDDVVLADKIRVLRNYGSRIKYHNEVKGVNSRLDELQAALLRVKMKKLDEWNERRSRIAQKYMQALAGMEGLTIPVVPDWAEPVWHLFVVRHPRRDELQQQLQAFGIGTLIHYPVPPHRSEAYGDTHLGKGSLPLTEALVDSVLSLPMSPHITSEHVVKVFETIREVSG